MEKYVSQDHCLASRDLPRNPKRWSWGGFLCSPYTSMKYEPVHEISNNVVCATSKASDQPAHARSLIRAVASRLSIL